MHSFQYTLPHQIMEGDLAHRRALARPHRTHPDRGRAGSHEPGTGEINFGFLLAHLDAIGYSAGGMRIQSPR